MKRLMTEEEYAAWQQNAKKRVHIGFISTPSSNRQSEYLKALETLESDKPTKSRKGKYRGR